MIRVALQLRENTDVRFIVYGKDYEDVRKQAIAFRDKWRKIGKKKKCKIMFDGGSNSFD